MLLAASQGGQTLKHSVWRAFLVPRIRVVQIQPRSKRMQRLGADDGSQYIPIHVCISPCTKLKVSSMPLENQIQRYNRSFGTPSE